MRSTDLPIKRVDSHALLGEGDLFRELPGTFPIPTMFIEAV